MRRNDPLQGIFFTKRPEVVLAKTRKAKSRRKVISL